MFVDNRSALIQLNTEFGCDGIWLSRVSQILLAYLYHLLHKLISEL